MANRPSALNAPSVVHSAKFLAIEAEAEPIEAEFEKARAALPSCLDKGYQAAYNRVRALRKQLSSLDKRSRLQFHKDNPEWVAFWGLRPA